MSTRGYAIDSVWPQLSFFHFSRHSLVPVPATNVCSHGGNTRRPRRIRLFTRSHVASLPRREKPTLYCACVLLRRLSGYALQRHQAVCEENRHQRGGPHCDVISYHNGGHSRNCTCTTHTVKFGYNGFRTFFEQKGYRIYFLVRMVKVRSNIVIFIGWIG